MPVRDDVVCPVAVEQYCNHLLVQNHSEKTVYQYRQDLITFFRYMLAVKTGRGTDPETLHAVDISKIGDSFLREITEADILGYMGYLAKDRANRPASRARKLSAVKSFLEYLVVTVHLLEENPAIHVKMPKLDRQLPKFLSAEESVLLLRTIAADEKSKHRVRDYTIVTLFLNCGMRLSELTGIDIRDIDRELRSIRVVGKGSKERIIYLNDACRAALSSYLPIRLAQSGIKDKEALFVSQMGNRLSNSMVQTMVGKYLEMAGLGYRNLSTHKLRHTAATLLYQSGEVDVRVLKDILGHEQLNTTQIYTHVSDRQMEEAMRHNPLSGLQTPAFTVPPKKE